MRTLYNGTSKRRKSWRRPGTTKNVSNSETVAYQEMVPFRSCTLTTPKSNKLGREQKGHGKAWLNYSGS